MLLKMCKFIEEISLVYANIALVNPLSTVLDGLMHCQIGSGASYEHTSTSPRIRHGNYFGPPNLTD